MAADAVLVLMARAPEPGRAKTRLAPVLGEAGAAELHRQLVLHACRALAGAGLGEVHLWLSGTADEAFLNACLARGVGKVERQRGADLGERMWHAASCSLAQASTVLMVGSDAPGLDASYLQRARGLLDSSDLVIGPARDGGYVLLGMRSAPRQLFEDIAWGGSAVLRSTLDRVAALGWRCALLPSLPDIDRPEDLAHLPPGLAVRPSP
jgi:rSAM/selenodomain-associated transferase 1